MQYLCVYFILLFLFFSVNILVLVNYNNPELDNKHYRHAH